MPSIYNERVHTAEYSVRRDKRDNNMFHVALDGEEFTVQGNVTDAHAAAARHARNHGHKGAGLTEQFGRNRQFVIGPRWGWHPWKEV